MLQAWTNNAPAGLPEPTMPRVAGYSLEQVDAFLGKLRKPPGRTRCPTAPHYHPTVKHNEE